MEVEVATCVCGVSSLPMGIGRVERHEGAGLQTWTRKGSKAQGSGIKVLDLGSAVSQAASLEQPNLRWTLGYCERS